MIIKRPFFRAFLIAWIYEKYIIPLPSAVANICLASSLQTMPLEMINDQYILFCYLPALPAICLSFRLFSKLWMFVGVVISFPGIRTNNSSISFHSILLTQDKFIPEIPTPINVLLLFLVSRNIIYVAVHGLFWRFACRKNFSGCRYFGSLFEFDLGYFFSTHVWS